MEPQDNKNKPALKERVLIKLKDLAKKLDEKFNISFIELIPVAVVVVTLLIVGSIWYKTIKIGSKSSDYNTVCIAPEGSKNGHEFYRTSFLAKGYMANHLNDDGTPVKCIVNE